MRFKMTFCMIAQLWNSNTPVIVSCDAEQTEKYMYISMKFRTGVHQFGWEVGVFNRSSSFQLVSYKLYHVLESLSWLWRCWWRWFNERTVQLRTFPLVPSPTGPYPARGDSGVSICINVCLVWSEFPTAFIVLHHFPVCRQLHTNSPGQLNSIWTWSNARMRSESSSPIGDRTRVARIAVQCANDWAV